MATFTVHQLDRDLPDRDLDTYRRLSFNDKEYQPEDFQLFNPVARVETSNMHIDDMLEQVFELTNRWHDLDSVRRFMPMHSLSVGDIIETHTGTHEYYIVSNFGFNKIEVA